MKIDSAVSNLRAAKHRFESYSKPLARFCLYVEAVIHVALRIVAERGSDSAAQHAKAFLTYINNERLVQLAMMADAADEALKLIRECDKEEWDTARMVDLVQNFMDRIEWLFEKNGVLDAQTFTAHMLNILKSVKSWTVNGTPKQIGNVLGVPAIEISRCLARMRAWRAVALSVLSAEFPDFELHASFAIFSLAPPDAGPAGRVEATGARDVHFRRLAQVLDLDHEKLRAQYDDHVYLARRLKSTQELGNGEAWRMAMEKTQRDSSIRSAHPAQELKAALMRSRAFSISTGGVERGFSKQMWLFGTSGDHQCERTMFLKAKLTNDYNDKEEIDVIKHAQLIWRKNWDDTRSRSKPRIDVGKAVGSRKQNTEKSWLANRHETITKAMRSASQRSHHALPAADIVAWEASHQEEKAYQ